MSTPTRSAASASSLAKAMLMSRYVVSASFASSAASAVPSGHTPLGRPRSARSIELQDALVERHRTGFARGVDSTDELRITAKIGEHAPTGHSLGAVADEQLAAELQTGELGQRGREAGARRANGKRRLVAHQHPGPQKPPDRARRRVEGAEVRPPCRRRRREARRRSRRRRPVSRCPLTWSRAVGRMRSPGAGARPARARPGTGARPSITVATTAPSMSSPMTGAPEPAICTASGSPILPSPTTTTLNSPRPEVRPRCSGRGLGDGIGDRQGPEPVVERRPPTVAATHGRRENPSSSTRSGSGFGMAKRTMSPSETPRNLRDRVPLGRDARIREERQVGGERVGHEAPPLAGDDDATLLRRASASSPGGSSPCRRRVPDGRDEVLVGPAGPVGSPGRNGRVRVAGTHAVRSMSWVARSLMTPTSRTRSGNGP